MFSITADGTIYHDGVVIGTIEAGQAHGRFEKYTVRGRTVENGEGDIEFSASIASASAVTVVNEA